VKRVVIALLATCALCATAPAFAQAPVEVKLGAKPNIHASSALLVDLSDNNQVLFSRDPHAVRAPASLTKIVTALVARDQYDLDETVTTDSHVLLADGTIGLTPGLHFTVRQLLYAMLLPSANDAAAALAAHDPYGYDHFIQLMNEKARSLGAVDSHFVNPHGLDAPGHYSSAWDMAIFARQLLSDPVLAEIVRTRHYNLVWPTDHRIRVLTNHNFLLGRYPGMIGVKTGYTLHAGHSLVTAVQTSQSLLLSVVMNSPNLYGETTALIDYGKALELGTTPGGGGADLPNAHLAMPPAAPALREAAPVRLSTAPLGKDPRDEPLWAMLLSGLAALTAVSLLVRRRTSRLQEAAAYYPSLRSVVGERRR
jgi:D-alanyl-D-alanine carboxypeptidase (penicillin-binding protein 5/6)